MKNFKVIIMCALCALTLVSCRFTSSTATKRIPIAINTVNSVGLRELNLERKDYTILKTITAEAVILYQAHGDNITMEEETGEFSIEQVWDEEKGWRTKKYHGVARYGFLSNDYDAIRSMEEASAGYIARNLAIYRAINQCKVYGADGMIEPVISMNVEERNDRKTAFKATVTAKLLKLKTDK